MPGRNLSFDDVRRAGRALPDVEEGTVYGSPALKVGGKMFACIAINKSAEPNTLAIRIAFEHRDELLAADPDTYYITDHYVSSPCVLVRLNRVHPDALHELLQMAWRFVSVQRKRSTSRRNPARRP